MLTVSRTTAIDIVGRCGHERARRAARRYNGTLRPAKELWPPGLGHDCRVHRVRRGGEHSGEPVATCGEHVAAAVLDGVANDVVVRRQRRDMGSGADSHSTVILSTSVHRNVRVPEGSALAAPRSTSGRELVEPVQGSR